jgi:hypothetical protein
MSWVANVLVSIDSSDHDDVAALNEWLRESCPWNGPSDPPGATGVGFLVRLTDRNTTWGGWKYPECDLWGGALNHADLPALLKRVQELPWKHPGCVQVFLMDQEESYFRLWMIREGELRQYAPEPDPSDDMSF